MTEYYTREEVDQLLESTKKQAVEEALRSLPFVVKSLFAQVGQISKLRETFYEKHKELASNKELTTRVMEEVEGKNAGYSYEKLLDETAKEAKRRLSGAKGMDNSVPEKPSRDQLKEGLDNIMGAFK